MADYRRLSVPFALVSPNGRIARAEYFSVTRLRLTFYSPIGANIGLPLGGIKYVCPGIAEIQDLLISDAGPDWVEVDTVNRLYTRLYVPGPITNITSPSGNFVTGYGKYTEFTPNVLITSANWNNVPAALDLVFDSDVIATLPPHTLEGRPFGGNWSPLPIGVIQPPDGVRHLWTLGSPFPVDFRLLTYPCRTTFNNGFLIIPQSGNVTPSAGGPIGFVTEFVPNDMEWSFPNNDLTAAVGAPPTFEVFHPTTGWLSPTALVVFTPNNAILRYALGGLTPTLWRFNNQPAGWVFTSGPLASPQFGSVI